MKAQSVWSEAQADVVREARLLLALAPSITMACLGEASDPVAIEALLRAGAFESAALALMPSRAAYMLSRGEGEGIHIASVILPGMEGEVTVHGGSVALALVGALVGALAGVEAGGDACDAEDRPEDDWPDENWPEEPSGAEEGLVPPAPHWLN